MRWLLERFGVEDALIGDIVEERRAGRSAAWVMRQTSMAIVRTTLRDWRSHPWLALRAIVVGWLCGGLAETLAEWVDYGPMLRTMPFWATFGAGWVVARLHRQPAMALAFASTYTIIGVVIAAAAANVYGLRLGLTMALCALAGGFLPPRRRSIS